MTVHLAVAGDVFYGVLIVLFFFSNEMSSMRSGTELSQFLKSFVPILFLFMFTFSLMIVTLVHSVP